MVSKLDMRASKPGEYFPIYFNKYRPLLTQKVGKEGYFTRHVDKDGERNLGFFACYGAGVPDSTKEARNYYLPSGWRMPIAADIDGVNVYTPPYKRMGGPGDTYNIFSGQTFVFEKDTHLIIFSQFEIQSNGGVE